MQKKSKKINDEINKILSEWNPKGVDNEIASDEYKGYIPAIINTSNNDEKLIACLEDILNKMELGYSSSNSLHKEELKVIAKKVLSIQFIS